MEFLYELKPQYDGRKSFYGETNVYRNDEGKILLMSYTTIVAEITDAMATEDGKPKLKNKWLVFKHNGKTYKRIRTTTWLRQKVKERNGKR